MDSLIEEIVKKLDFDKLQKKFFEQDELIFIEEFVPKKVVEKIFVPEVRAQQQHVHRSYLPTHKKSGSVSAWQLGDSNSLFIQYYEAEKLKDFICSLVKTEVATCPKDDPHSVALYYYSEKGDHIGYHYDSSFYQGKRYTVLMGLVDESSAKLECQLFRKRQDVETELLELSLSPGCLLIFNGDNLYHQVTPLGENEERIVLTMEFVTDGTMGSVNRVLSNMKDAVTYFGMSNMLSFYKKLDNDKTKENDSELALKKLNQLSKEDYKHENENPNASYIVVFINKNSGGRRGGDCIHKLIRLLGDDRVFDLTQVDPTEILKNLKKKGTKNLRVICGGGDGTIRWIIQSLINAGYYKKLNSEDNEDNEPYVGILPLGTGNDLSRGFGWNSCYKGEDLKNLVPEWKMASAKPLDIWKVKITPYDEKTGEQKKGEATSEIMFNYFNMGFDAQAALGFHNYRANHPQFFTSRFINKCWYVYYALGAILEGSPDLSETLSIVVDDNKVLIPPDIKTIIFLSFTSYQAGADIWGEPKEKNSKNQKFSKPSSKDDKIEIIGISGLFHEACLRLYLKNGIRLAQGSNININVSKTLTLPMAFDGEPFLNQPYNIQITPRAKVNILHKKGFKEL